MGRLTTHVLDTALGRPAAGLGIDLYAEDSPGVWRHVKSVVTNADGRVDSPLLGPGEMAAGAYELLFHAGDYLKATSAAVSDPPFLDHIPIRFSIADPAAHYHVPLLVSAFAYSTYRGS